jgi:UDP-N-acetylglucosamine--N-acetylmuramyl-(pentapeptide) pyrophosphoryl-undecaprenol N-acetylglucosamine transferase
LLAGRATAIATSFAQTGKVPTEARDAVVLTGNPVRAGIRALRGQPYPAPSETGAFELLVTGGSQGASVFAELIPEAIANLPETLRSRIRISQQVREAELDRVVGIYRHLGIEATVRKFFGDMPERLAAAHLLVCRSGASTVAENTVAGRPSLLVPYPHATDDHQTANAHAIEAEGAAWTFPQADLSVERLSERLADLMSHPETLIAAAAAAHEAGVPDAVERLADLVANTARLRSGQALRDPLPADAPSSGDTPSVTQRAVA